ncbi:unnamed protein product [Clavelina lepadiformis]|uniref:Translin-associated factor X-interacting protein 1 N-terminal domain-containing protein n=1 Tax=Clavelina lepadiformis TaxID=159417 RepID=A0ABP0FCR0_CLALP
MDNLDSITPEALRPTQASRFSSQKSVLPPILCDKDKNFLAKVHLFVEEEKQKTRFNEDDQSSQRFAIYSEAFNLVVNHVTVYKDILADIKREYEECINALQNGQRDTLFIRNKIKALASLPSAIAGYQRRKIDLEEKLAILTADNERLQTQLDTLKIRDDQSEVTEEKQGRGETPEEFEEKRPIPGLTVAQWTDETILQESVSRLDRAMQEVLKQQKSAYVPISKKIETEALLQQRIKARDDTLSRGLELRKKNVKIKAALDALKTYKQKKEENRDFKEDLGEYMIKVLRGNRTLQRQLSWMDDGENASFEEDDPSKEKEAELILEYIDKFNDFFLDEEYEKAAVHAANSPRGVLRTMETLKRFCDVSRDYKSLPSPLLVYSEALMHSSAAQEHVVDEEMSLICARCALDENRPELIEHWISQPCITVSDELGSSLVEYSQKHPQYEDLCLAIAHEVFVEVQNHMEVCKTFYQLNQLSSLLDYSKNVAKFTTNQYLQLIRCCPSGRLAWNLCRPSNELTPDLEQVDHPMMSLYQATALPIRFDQAICALINADDVNAADIAARFLDDVYTDGFLENEDGYVIRSGDVTSLHRIVYDETDSEVADDVISDWMRVAQFCEDNDLTEVAMEIRAAQVVKKAIEKALRVIAQDEKEAFDYYT